MRNWDRTCWDEVLDGFFLGLVLLLRLFVCFDGFVFLVGCLIGRLV